MHRARYPQLPAYSNLYETAPTYGASASFYSSGLGNSPFNQSGYYGSGRSNVYSPTYSMGLSEVVASRASGPSVLCLEPQRRSRKCFYNLKLKHIAFLFLGLLAFTVFTMNALNNYIIMSNDVTAYELKNQPNTKSEHLQPPEIPEMPETSVEEIPEALPKVDDDLDANYKHDPILIPASAVDKQQENKYSKIVYDFDDINDEVYIEDVIL